MTRHILFWLTGMLLGLGMLACGSDSESQSPAAFAPYMPPAMETPAVDDVYLQEYNHTLNEVEVGIGALVSVFLPPESWDGYDVPTQVTPRGIIRHTDSGFELLAIDEAHSDLIAAAANDTGAVLINDTTLFALAADGSISETAAPDGLTITALVPGAEALYILTTAGVGTVSSGTVTWPEGNRAATAATETDTHLLVARGNSVEAYHLPFTGDEQTPDWTWDNGTGTITGLVTGVTLPQALDVVLAGNEGVVGLTIDGSTPTEVTVAEFAADRVPLGDIRGALKASDGGFILFTSGGACRIMDRGHGMEWRVYNAERWMPSEDVRQTITDPTVPDGPIWFATAAGLGTVTAKRVTLEEKLEHFVQRVVERHDRDGAVADSHLTVKGDLSTNIPWDSDNDGLWTSFWLLAECFRYKTTGDEDAKTNFDKSLRAMLNLQDLTGTDHFVARALIRKDGCQLNDCDDPDDGEWFTSADGEWWVKGDTSNDEVIGHVFMMGHAYDLCADDDQKVEIADHIDAIIGGIVDNGYQLVDIDGECTKHGQLDPGYVNDSISGEFGDGGTRSVEMMAATTLAYYLTGDQKYMDAKFDLIHNHHYDINAITEADYTMRIGSGDGDEMGTAAWFSLLRYEQDEALRARWMEGWDNTREHLKLQQAAFWDMVNAVVGGPEPDMDIVVRWLRLAPMDMIRWHQHNSHRLDLAPAPSYYKDGGKMRTDGFIIPYDERRCDRWNTDQFRVDGGMGGMVEMDGADVLAPYWMARYYGFIVPKE